jgi:hypothetical protein
MSVIYNLILTIVFLVLPCLSHAYVGPGLGLSAIGSIIAFIGAIVLLIVGFVWYPIKRLLKGMQFYLFRKVGREVVQEDVKPESYSEERK